MIESAGRNVDQSGSTACLLQHWRHVPAAPLNSIVSVRPPAGLARALQREQVAVSGLSEKHTVLKAFEHIGL